MPPPIDEIMPAVAVSASSAGNGLIATRAIGAGTTILQVAPDVVASAWPCSLEECTIEEVAVLRRERGDGASFHSSGCDEWMCGEAQALWLLAIRCALKARRSPAFLAALFELEDHCQCRPAASQVVVAAAGVRLSGALYAAGLVEQTSVWFSRLFGVLLTNAFGVRGGAALGSQRLDVRAPMLALSLSASLFNHRCDPNVGTDHLLIDGVLSFRASQSIAVGDECFISYTATEEPTYVRQRELMRAKQFHCRCSLCVDPLESDRCSSFLRCLHCERGWQRQQTGDATLSAATANA